MLDLGQMRLDWSELVRCAWVCDQLSREIGASGIRFETCDCIRAFQFITVRAY